MKNIYALLFIFWFLPWSSFSQTIDFSFTAEQDGFAVQLDSVRIHNRTQDCDTVLTWPDTVLSMMYNAIGTTKINTSSFRVYPCTPNPVRSSTSFTVFLPGSDPLKILVTNPAGVVLLKQELNLAGGSYNFEFTPGAGQVFILSAIWRGISSSIKIISIAQGATESCQLAYKGEALPLLHMEKKANSDPFKFYLNDQLLIVGYANGKESGLFDQPYESKSYRLSYDYNKPCSGIPALEYGGQLYHTVQIYNQCWLKENLNIGKAINGYFLPTNNDTIEKYCYDNDLANCAQYGGLYHWKEMMNYTTKEEVQGICPDGWHIPSDAEWILLEASADSVYSIFDTIWDIYWISRGYDVGYNLKGANGWKDDGNGSDKFGFAGKPAGYRWHNGWFYQQGAYAFWWTSSQYSYGDAWYRIIYYYSNDMYRNGDLRKVSGLSVRCLKD